MLPELIMGEGGKGDAREPLVIDDVRAAVLALVDRTFLSGDDDVVVNLGVWAQNLMVGGDSARLFC